MPAPFVEDAFFFPLYNFSFCQKSGVHRCVDLIPLPNLTAFLPIPSCFHYSSSVIELDVRDGEASRSSFNMQDCFGYPGFFVFSIES